MGLHFHLISAVLVLIVGLAGGAWALRVGASSTPGSRYFMRMGAALAGGVFLGAGLIHMLGDASSTMDKAFPDVDYPIAFAIATVGFVMVLAVERVVFRAASAAEGPFAYILILVLGLHSLLAGIALGIEGSGIVGLAIVVAILAHKGAAAFSLGVSFVKANMPKCRAWGLIATFSCVTPFGIFIGSALGSILSGENGEIVEGVFDALAAGSFMYIAAVDIITEEFGDAEHSHIPGFAALLAGLGLMTVLAMFV